MHKRPSRFPWMLLAALCPLLLILALLWLMPQSPTQQQQSQPQITADAPSAAPSKRVKFVTADKKQHSPVDRREQAAVPKRAVSRAQGLEDLSKNIPGLVADFDSISGAPSRLQATGRLLTEAAPGRKPAEVVADFVDGNASLFGHDSKAFQSSRLAREDITAHNGMTTLVWHQEVEGIPVFQSIFKANVTKDGRIITVNDYYLAEPKPTTRVAQGKLNADQAISKALESLGDKVSATPVGNPERAEKFQRYEGPGISDTTSQLTYMPMDESTVRAAYDITSFSLAQKEMFRFVIDAVTGDLLWRQSLTADISNATYRVYADATTKQPLDSPTPLSPGHATVSSTQPTEVPRTLIALDALNTTASPNGWINDGITETMGNNVDAHTDTNNDNAPDLPRPTSPSRNFDFPADLTQGPTTYQNALVTHLFYMNNWIHDRMYSLGFTESAGNFQNNNFGKGGLGNDAVQADAQDGSGTNNANFSTPADGSPGRMQMYIWTAPNPDRDSDYDSEIIIHEYGHGISNRLVGGGVGISAWQSRGMGEGWSDFYALALLARTTDDVNGTYPMGGYSLYLSSGMTTNHYFGIRRYPYSADLAKSPLTYKDIDPGQASPHTGVPLSPRYGSSNQDPSQYHAQGEVWCNMLFEVRRNLILKHGAELGNELALQLVTDGLKLTPANPTFIQARDAIVQADVVNNASANLNQIWAGFAKRGIGASASGPSNSTTAGVVESFDIPDDLSVNPSGLFAVTTQVGTMPSPLTREYTLTNTGTAALAWTAASSQPWMSLAPASGTLAPGADVTVTATFTAAAGSLRSGSYNADLNFINAQSGNVIPRQVSLVVEKRVIAHFVEDFETVPLSSAWEFAGTSTWRTVQTTANVPHGGDRHLTMDSTTDSSYARNEATWTLDLSGKRNLSLIFWAKSFGEEPNGPPPSPFPTTGADFDGVAVSADGGANWYEIQGLRTLSAAWQKLTVDLDAAIATLGLSYGPNFKIRFNQYDNYSIATDGIAIDDITVAELQDNVISIEPLTSLVEGGAPATGRLRILPVQAEDKIITLSVSGGQATVPSTVTLTAGLETVDFEVAAVNDTLLDGSQEAVISANADGFPTGTSVILVHDDETTALSVVLPPSITEGAPAVTGSVRTATAVGADVAVTLSSSISGLSIPTTVVIPAGSRTASFIAAVTNDNAINGSRTATVEATVRGWTSGQRVVTVVDDENRELALALNPSMMGEADGTLTNVGRVSIDGVLTTDLAVSLGVSPDVVTLPATVTIPAGQTTVSFGITATQNTSPEGPRTGAITASATDFTSATAQMTVHDDDGPPMPFRPQPAHLSTGNPPGSNLAWSAATGEAITNGGFEQGFDGWTLGQGSSGTYRIQDGRIDPPGTEVPVPPYAGAAAGAMITPGNGGPFTLSQDFTVPLDGPTPVLSWAQRMRNNATSYVLGTTEYRVELQNPDTGARLSTLYAANASTPAVQDWQLQTANLAALRGQRVRLVFHLLHLSGLVSVHLDAVSLSASQPDTDYLVYFGTHPSLGSGDLLGSTSSKMWDLPALSLGSSYYWQVVTRQGAALQPGPVWQFTTGAGSGVASFAFGAIADPQTAGRSFLPNLRALDSNGNLAADFNGEVTLTAVDPSQRRSSILISEINPNTSDEVEFTNVSSKPVDVSGWKVVIGDFASFPGELLTYVLPAETVVPAGGVFITSETGSGTYPNLRLPATLNWTNTSRGAVVLKDLHGDLVDAAMFGGDPVLWRSGMGIPEAEWSGGSLPSLALTTQSWQRTGDTDRHYGTDFVGADLSIGARNAALTVPFPSTLLPTGVPDFFPRSVTLKNGQWLGGVTFQGAGSGIQLRAKDAESHAGKSSIFSVLAPNGTITLTGASTVSEADGTLTAYGTVTLPSPALANEPVRLISSDITEAQVSAVTVAAGSSTVTFALSVQDDALRDGPQTVTLQAAADGYTGANLTLLVTDDESTTLTLQLASNAYTEGGAPPAASVVLNSPADQSITVAVSSSLPSTLTVPNSIVIPAGAASAPLPLTGINNLTVDGTRSVTLTATVAGWPVASGIITVTDDESPVISVSTPSASYPESQGTVMASVGLSAPSAVTRSIALSSSVPGRVSVPATVSIPAGASSASVPLTFTNDTAADADASVVITAASAGLTDGTRPLTVRDDDPHHFAFGTVADQVATVPFDVTITAKTVSENTAVFTGSATLTATGVSGAASVTIGPFSAGTFTASYTLPTAGTSVELTADSGSGIAGSSNTFGVSGTALHHFDISTISSPQVVNTPFSLTITARDSANDLAAYPGPATLSVLGASSTKATGADDSTLSTVISTQATTAGRAQMLVTSAEAGGAGVLTGLSLTFETPPPALDSFVLRLRTTTATSISGNFLNTGWTTVHSAPLSAGPAGPRSFTFSQPFSLPSDMNLLVDVLWTNAAPVNWNATVWGYYAYTSGYRFRYNTSNAVGAQPESFTTANGDSYSPNLRLERRSVLPLAPATTAAFSNSVWAGNVRIPPPSSPAVVMVSDPSSGIFTLSSPFTLSPAEGNISLSTVGSVSEAGSTATVTVTASSVSGVDRSFQILSSSPDLLFPSSVTLAASNLSAAFTVSAVDDSTIEGTEAATLEVVRPGYATATTSLEIVDNDSGTLSLTAPASVTEGFSNTCTVTLSSAVTIPTTVVLTSSDIGELHGPATVTVPAGSTSATFSMYAPNDNILDGTQSVTLTASNTTFGSTEATISVMDGDLEGFYVSGFPTSVLEGSSTAVYLYANDRSPAERIITLTSSDSASLAVPATLTFPANSTSMGFTVTCPLDGLTDGAKAVTLTLSSPGSTDIVLTRTVVDVDLHHFNWAAIATPKVLGQSVPVSLTAKNIDDTTLTSYGGPVTLSAAAGGSPLTLSPTTVPGFASGVWTGTIAIPGAHTGVVLTATDDSTGVAGNSNSFDLAIGPLHHFDVSMVPSPQQAGAPFPVTVTAKDDGGNTVEDFTGSADLSALIGGGEITTGTGSVVPSGFPLYTYYHDNRTQSIYLASEVGAARNLTSLALNVAGVPAQTMNNFTIRLKHTSLSSYSSPSWESTGWTTVYQSNQNIPTTGWNTFTFSAPFAWNGTNNLMVDISFNNTTWTSEGSVYGTTTAATRTIFRYTDSLDGDPLTWAGTTPAPSTSSTVANLRFSGSSPLPTLPTSAPAFTAGVWTGDVAALAPGTGMTLQVKSGAIQGSSSSFDVLGSGSLSLSLPATAAEGTTPAGTITRSGSTASPLVVNFVSSDTSELATPASVTIPAGSTSAPVPLVTADDTDLDGTQPVTVTAWAAGITAGTASMGVTDNETAVLSVILPEALTEGGTGTSGTVTLSATPAAAITVNLSSSDTSELTVPASVTIPAGTLTASFAITQPQDAVLDGPQPVTVIASVQGFTSGSATATVQDDESTNLTLSGNLSTEGNTPYLASLFLAASTQAPRTFTLTSNDDSELLLGLTTGSVPGASVTFTINAGSSSGSFAIFPQDDTLKDGPQSVTLTCTSPSYPTQLLYVSIQDNEVDHYTINTITSPQTRNAPVTVSAFARDVLGNSISQSAVNYPITFSATAGSISIPLSTPTSTLSFGSRSLTQTIAQAATGVVITVEDSFGNKGFSNAFDVQNLGTLDHFNFAAISSPVGVNADIPVTVTAVDVGNNTLPSYSGPVALKAYAAPTTHTVGTGTLTWSHPFNAASTHVRTQMLYNTTELGTQARRLNSIGFDIANTSTTTFFNLVIRLQHTTSTSTSTSWTSTGWTTVYSGSATFSTATGFRYLTLQTPFDYNGTSNLLVDVSFQNSVTGTTPFTKYIPAGSSRTLYMNTSSTVYGSPTTWSGTNPPGLTTTGLPNISFNSNLPVPLTPSASGTFTNGAWTGSVKVTSATSPTVLLNATDTPTGKRGDSGNFTITSAGTLALGVSPTSTTEGGAPVTGTVYIPTAVGAPVLVNLSSSDSTEAIVPTTVTIPAGSTSNTFSITPVQDSLRDGSQTVTIGVNAGGYLSASQVITVGDDDGGQLSLTLPGYVVEDYFDFNVSGTVRIDAASSSALTVNLSSVNPSAATVPATVIIPAGSVSANFTITILSNTTASGNQSALITASAPGWSPGSSTINVVDDDMPILSISPYSGSPLEGSNMTLWVSRTGSTTNALTVDLSSSSSSATLPASVTLAAGSSSQTVTVSFANDTAALPNQGVVIEASSAGFLSSSTYLLVWDNDPVRLAWTNIPASITAGNSFYPQVQVVNADGNSISIPSTSISLSASGSGTSIAVSPTSSSFFTGYWYPYPSITQAHPSVTLTAVTGTGIAGTSSAFAVLPAATSTLQWSTIPSPQSAGTAFSATITARDAHGNVTPTFTGPASLSIRQPAAATGTGTSTTTAAVANSGYATRRQTLYLASELGAPRLINAISFDKTTSSSGTSTPVFTLRVKRTSATSYASPQWDNLGWTTVFVGSVTQSAAGWFSVPLNTPFYHDGVSNLMLDVSTQYTSSNTSYWSLRQTSATPNRCVVGSSSASTTPNPATWGANSYSAAAASVLNARFESIFSVSPTQSGTFSSGVWTGTLTVDEPVPSAVLTASSPGLLTDSNSFEIVGLGTLSFTLPASLAEGTTASASVEVSSPPAADLTVSLQSFGPSRLSVPSTVIIPAGTTTAPFTLTALNEAVSDGDFPVALRATATHYRSAAGSATVTDDDPLALFVSVPTSISEGSSAVTNGGQVSLSKPLSTDLLVSLTSSDSSELNVPASIVIPSGISAVPFTLTPVNDTFIDGSQSVTITATAPTALDGTTSVSVLDNESTTLGLTFTPSTVSESAGTATGTVSLPAPLETPAPVVVSLSATTTQFTLPTSVTIPSGDTSVNFPVTVLSDTVPEYYSEQIGVTATASGFFAATNYLTVRDDDPSSFSFNFISSQPAYTPFTATVYARDIYGYTLTGFNGNASLTVSAGNTVSPSTIGPFVNGVWTGQVRVGGSTSATLTASLGTATGSSSFSITGSTGTPTISFTSTSPPENTVLVTATLTLPAAVGASPLTVFLASSDTTEATVPSSVVVPALASFTTFSVTIANDTTLDGPQSVIINAFVPGYNTAGTGTLNVQDDETTTLAVSFPGGLTEGQGLRAGFGTVTLGTVPEGVIALQLSSSDNTEVTVPASVTVPAGNASATFDVTVINDAIVDGPQTVNITASRVGWSSATTPVIVEDNDPHHFAISAIGPQVPGVAFPITITAESASNQTLTGFIGTVNLSCLATGPKVLPVVPAATTAFVNGVWSGSISLSGDGSAAILTATASGISGTSAPFDVMSAAPASIAFSNIGNQTAGATFPVTLTAKNAAGGTETGFYGRVNFTATALAGPLTPSPTTSGNFTAGVWTGNLSLPTAAKAAQLTATPAASGGPGTSNAFNVVGAMTQLAVSTPPAANSGTPMSVTVTAKDAADNTVPSFSGAANLWASAPSLGQALVGNGQLNSSTVLAASSHDSRAQIIYTAAQLGSVSGSITSLSLNVSSGSATALNAFTIRLRHTSKVSYTAGGAAWESADWTTCLSETRTFSTGGWQTLTFTTPFTYNGTDNLMVDLSFNNAATGTSVGLRTDSTAAVMMMTAVSNSAAGDPLTWVAATPSPASQSSVPQLRFDFAGGTTLSTYTTGSFNAGIWAGPLAFTGSNSIVTLRARTTGGFEGSSAPLAVHPTLPVVISQSHSTLTNQGATVQATINPNGGATTARVIYGTDPALASATSSSADQSLGAGTSDVSISPIMLTALSPGTTYYYRMEASHSSGSTLGSIQSFTTAAPDIQVSTDSTPLISGSSSVDFGSTVVGGSVVKTFTVSNTGNWPLSITTAQVSSPWSINTSSMASSVPAGESTTFTATYTATAQSLQESQFTLISDDPGEQPFEVQFTGQGASPQTITFAPIPAQVVGSAWLLSASSTSGLPITFNVVSGPATISGGIVYPTAVGDVTVRASQVGSLEIDAAPDVERTFSVGKGTQTLAFSQSLLGLFHYTSSVNLFATSNRDLNPVTYGLVDGSASLLGSLLSFTGPGNVLVSASQSGDVNYHPAFAQWSLTSYNNPPTALPSVLVVSEDAPPSTRRVTGLDEESLVLTFAVQTQPTKGTLAFNPDGTYTYTPALNTSGSDSFRFIAFDGFDPSLPGTVTIHITEIDDAPIVTDVSFVGQQDDLLTGALPATEPDLEPMTLAIVTGPVNGSMTLSADGSFRYQPAPGFVGVDNFEFSAADAHTTVTATITLVINPVAPHWTWAGGAKLPNQKTTATAPGARTDAASWIDTAGRWWLFGGRGYGAAGGPTFLSDLWRCDPSTQTWTQFTGPGPSPRSGTATWTTPDGMLWLHGGQGQPLPLQDLWKLNPATGTWTQVSSPTATIPNGQQGTAGQPATTNYPSRRSGAVAWTDTLGNLWLFGGKGYSASGTKITTLNDLWRYRPSDNTWMWTGDHPSAPSARADATAWTSYDGHTFYLFGGLGNAPLDDLWTYTPTSNTWTLLSPNTDYPGPSARHGASAWTDAAGRLLLFGGQSKSGHQSDVWRFDTSERTWALLKGPTTPNLAPSHGSLNFPAASNTPGARRKSATFQDKATGDIIAFGGSNGSKLHSDLWTLDMPALPVITDLHYTTTATSFTLHAMVNPRGMPTLAGISTTIPDIQVGAGNSPVEITRTINHPLEESFSTIVTAVNSLGTATSRLMVTGPAPSPAPPATTAHISAPSQVSEDADEWDVSISLDGAASPGLNLPLLFSGTATQGVDYEITGLNTTFINGQSSLSFRIKPLADTMTEGAETIIIDFATPLPAGISSAGPATITLLDIAPQPTVSTTAVSRFVSLGAPDTVIDFDVSWEDRIQWMKNNKPIKGDFRWLTLPGTPFSAAGVYTLTAYNPYGQTQSAPIELCVIDTTDTPITLKPGASAKLTAKAASAGVLDYQWMKDGSGPIAGATLPNHTVSESGTYWCQVSRPGTSIPPGRTGDFSVEVVTGKPELTSPLTLPAGTIGHPYSFAVPFTSDPLRAPSGFTARGLPAGLAITASGMIQGRPTAAVLDKPISITAKNSLGSSTTVRTTLTIRALPPEMVGSYVGAISRGNGNQQQGGRLDITVLPNGSYTAKSSITKYKGLLQITVDDSGQVHASLNDFILSGSFDAATQTFTGSELSEPVTAYRLVWSPRSNRATAYKGYHTFLADLPDALVGDYHLPQGTSFGTATITDAGKANVVMSMADGQKITLSTIVGPNGQIPIYGKAAKLGGSIVGVNLCDGTQPTKPHTGTLSWASISQSSIITLRTRGGLYTPPAKNTVIMDLPNTDDNARISFYSPAVSLSDAPPRLFSIRSLRPTSNVQTITPPAGLSLKLDLNKGTYSATSTITHTNPALTRTIKAQGILVRTASNWQAGGWFLFPALPQPGQTLKTSPLLSGQVAVEPAIP